ncbi:MAG: 2-oxo acid dehydrogenase subunit E2, partial [Candidatus Eisenbacteria bacterium]|nr:2-oxo acid dehydrogenase subunit E2 [Candidatus Eisenbacteria bacterium]
ASAAAPASMPQAPAAPMAQPMPTMPVYQVPARSGKLESYPAFQVAESRTTPEGRIDVVPMDRMRGLIAEHMVRSKATSPHVASVTEVDMTPIVRHRESMKKAFEGQHGFKLTYTPYIVEAAVKALLDYPMMNSTVENGQILLKRFVNLGVAVALESGLIVPVVRHAEEKNFLGLSRAIDDLANRARSKQLRPDEVAGGTFTVTNMGSFGNLFGIPIINQPQSGILGVGAIVKRPVVVGDAIAIRDIMYLSLSYDHRHVDGKLGGLFIQRVRHYLETFDPAAH